ncbi:MAG: GNAT family N-acetyltransferase [Chloroflexota bacterium]
MLIADQLAANGQSVLGADYIRKVWTKPGFELATDAWVVTEGADNIVAYGQVTRDVPDIVESWGVVDPEYRARGIGSVLFERIEMRASELLAGIPSSRFRHAIDARDLAAAGMLRARGLQPVRHFWHMQMDLTSPFEPVPPPKGIEISRIEPRDLLAVHTVLQDGFADDWGHHPQPFDQWAGEQARNPRYDPTLWLLARSGRKPVGALTASAAADGGWVDELAVLPQHRRCGIGTTLLGRAFATLAGRGLQRALLNVDAANPAGATELYERVGMRVVDRWDLWGRSLRRSA